MIYKSYCDVFCQNSCFCVFSAFMENWIFGPSVFPVLFMGTFLENDNAHIPWSDDDTQWDVLWYSLKKQLHRSAEDFSVRMSQYDILVFPTPDSTPNHLQRRVSSSRLPRSLYLFFVVVVTYTHAPLWFICSFPYYSILTQISHKIIIFIKTNLITLNR